MLGPIPTLDVPRSDGVVALRAWREEDVPVRAAWGRDAEVVRWTGVPADYDEAQVRAFWAFVEAERERGYGVSLAIADATTDAILGSCDVRRVAPEENPALGEIGFLLGAEARGRGVATRAMRLLTAWAIETLALERIQAAVHPDNARSMAVLERAGFTREGLLRGYRAVDAGREDRVMYGLLANPSLPTGAPK